MTDEQAAQLIEQNNKLLDANAALRNRIASLEAELQQQKDLVAALLKRLYGSKSEQLSRDQLLMTFLEDEAKKPDAAESKEKGPAAEIQTKAPRAKRTSKLADSLKERPAHHRAHHHFRRSPQESRGLPPHRRGSQRTPPREPRRLHP